MSDDSKLMLPALTVAQVTLKEPRAFQEGDAAKYSLGLLIPKSDKALIKKIQTFISKNVKASTHADAMQKRIFKSAVQNTDPDNKNLVIKDGDEKLDQDGNYATDKYPFYTDHFYVNLKRHEKMGAPGLFGPDNKQLPSEVINSEIYPGCDVRVQVEAYIYTKPTPGFSLTLSSVQKYRNGDKFGQSSPFDVIETEEEEEGEEFNFDSDADDAPPMGARAAKSKKPKKRPAKKATKKKPVRKKRR